MVEWRGTPRELWEAGIDSWRQRFHAKPVSGEGRVLYEVTLVIEPDKLGECLSLAAT